MGAATGGGKRGSGSAGWVETRAAFAELWQGREIDWSDDRAEQLFLGVVRKLETRKRRRRAMRLAIASVAVTILVGLGLVGSLGGSGPLVHLLSRVHAGLHATT